MYNWVVISFIPWVSEYRLGSQDHNQHDTPLPAGNSPYPDYTHIPDVHIVDTHTRFLLQSGVWLIPEQPLSIDSWFVPGHRGSWSLNISFIGFIRGSILLRTCWMCCKYRCFSRLVRRCSCLCIMGFRCWVMMEMLPYLVVVWGWAEVIVGTACVWNVLSWWKSFQLC